MWVFSGVPGIDIFELPAGGGGHAFTLDPSAYVLAETVQANYTADVSCSDGSTGGKEVNVSLAPGAQVSCTFTNTYIVQTLTVSKVVEGGPLLADDFDIFVNDQQVRNGVPTELATGTHTVTESSVPSYTAAFSGDCDASGVVELAIGQDLLCVLTNIFVPPSVVTQTLTVSKVVEGGPLIPGDFGLFVNGNAVTNGVPTELAAGTYTVTERSVPAYALSFSGRL